MKICLYFFVVFGLSIFSSAAYSGYHGKKVGATLHKKEAVPIDSVPENIILVIKKHQPDFKMLEAEKELKHGNTYFDVEGLDAQGNEIEFDMLLGKDGTWSIAEIQRDLMFKQVPKPVIQVFQNEASNIEPARIIESDQGNGVIIYEFYTQEKDKEKKYEVKLSVELLKKEWKH